MEWLAIGKLAKTYWSQIVLGLMVLGLVVSLGITRHTLATRTATLHNTEQAYRNFQKEVKNKTEAAKLADQAHAAAVHAKDEAVRIKNEQTLQDQLDAAHRAAADYALRLRLKASGDTRRIGPQGVSPAANSSGPAAGTSQNSVVDETEDNLQICAENTVKAQGWPDWWRSIQAVPDRE